VSAKTGAILVIGKTGQVARSLEEVLSARGYAVTAIGRPEVDLRDPITVASAIRDARPAIVVNAAAYTAVDRAEDEPDDALAVNAIGAQAVADAAAGAGVPIIHISTDYVFDGEKRAPYVETDAVAPIGAYGRSKLLGEQLVAAANPKHVILRTAWVFSPFGSNFVRTMLRLSAEKPEIRVVDDQHGNPTYALDLADVIRQIIDRLVAPSPDPECFGTFHAVNAGVTTWFGFAEAVLSGAERRRQHRAALQPIGTKDYPTRARRPAYSVLATDKLARIYGIRLRPWTASLADCLDRLLGPENGAAASDA
jgi:dTDP-4-dehydrorhamnose reductase